MNKIKFLVLFFLLILLLSSCKSDSNELSVHFIDVGQGDSTLIITPQNHSILIDAGNNTQGENIKSYLNDNNIDQIDLLIGTHPDADHIGGLDFIIYNFPVKQFFMTQKLHTTKSFTDVLKASKKTNLAITLPKYGEIIQIEENLTLQFLGPDKIYDDNNQSSIIVKLDYLDSKFLFMGDAEIKNEEILLNSNFDLDSDVIKLGHHGSSSSSSFEFLKRISPSASVISCGYNNSYHHPHKEVLNVLKKLSIPLFRTDEQHDIIFYSDGYKISSNRKPGSYEYR